jgi:hypothetical protein
VNSVSSFRSDRLRHYDGLERIHDRNILLVWACPDLAWLVTDAVSCSSHLLFQAQGSWFAYILPSALVNLSSPQKCTFADSARSSRVVCKSLLCLYPYYADRETFSGCLHFVGRQRQRIQNCKISFLKWSTKRSRWLSWNHVPVLGT